MKKMFEIPVLDVLRFTAEDILTASGGNGGGGIELPDDEWE